MKYKVYIWLYSCLDYPLDVLISWIRIWACTTGFIHIYFTWCFIDCLRVHVLMTRFFIYVFLIWIYRYTYDCLCMPLSIILRICWVTFWQPLNLHVQIPELGHSRPLPCSFFLIAVAWWISDKSSVAVFSAPLDQFSRFPFCCSWAFTSFHIVHIFL